MEGLEELYTRPVILDLGSEKFTLQTLTLRKEIEFKEVFGSVDNVFLVLNEEPKKIYEVLHFFTDKSLDLETFKKTILLVNRNDLGNYLYQKFVEVLTTARPIAKNVKRAKEIKEVLGHKDQKEMTYSDYYDRIASRYGYSINDFLDLTLKQVQALVKASDAGRVEELKIEAKLAGKELKEPMVYEDLSVEEEEKQEEDAKEMFERLKKQYQGRANGS